MSKVPLCNAQPFELALGRDTISQHANRQPRHPRSRDTYPYTAHVSFISHFYVSLCCIVTIQVASEVRTGELQLSPPLSPNHTFARKRLSSFRSTRKQEHTTESSFLTFSLTHSLKSSQSSHLLIHLALRIRPSVGYAASNAARRSSSNISPKQEHRLLFCSVHWLTADTADYPYFPKYSPLTACRGHLGVTRSHLPRGGTTPA